MSIADHHVELVVGAEPDPTAVVIAARAGWRGEQDPEVGSVSAVVTDPHQQVAERAVPRPRDVDVDERLRSPGWIQRDPERPSLAGAVHARDRVEEMIRAGLRVEDPHLARGSFQVPDLPAR